MSESSESSESLHGEKTPSPTNAPLAETGGATPPEPKPRLPRWVSVVACLFIIGVLAALAIPNFVKARTTSCKSACVANLKQIDGAIQQWALENKKVDSNPVDLEAAKKYLKGGVLPTCPSGAGSYAAGTTVADAPTCTFRYQSGEGHSLP